MSELFPIFNLPHYLHSNIGLAFQYNAVTNKKVWGNPDFFEYDKQKTEELSSAFLCIIRQLAYRL